MRTKQTIHLSTSLCTKALKSKESTDALALALLVKFTFVNSVIKDATLSKVMKVFHISYARCKSAIAAGVDMGLFHLDGNRIVVGKINARGEYNILLKVRLKSAMRQTGEISAPYTVTQMCNLIRKAALINHISKQSNLFDTLRLATQPRPSETELMKKAKRKLSKRNMQAGNIVSDGQKLSYKRMSVIMGCSASLAKKLVKFLVRIGVLEKQLNFEDSGLHIDQFSKAIQNGYRQSGGRGFMVRRDGQVMLQCSNSYSINDAPIRYLKNRKSKMAKAA